MNIRHNVQAMRANQSFAKSIYQQRQAMDRISSGVRVNKSGDDPSVMALSHKMRSQINGLSKAQRNSEDGISLIRTAESGLNEIQTHLNRMRELCLQASNGTLNEDDRKKVQDEITNSEKAIDDIANYTQFNKINVLAPPIVRKDPPPPPKVEGLDIVFLIDNSGSMTEEIGYVKDGIKGFIDNMNDTISTKVAVVSLCSLSDYRGFSSNPNFENVAGGLTRPYDAIEQSMPDGSIGKQLGYREGSKKVFVLFTDTDNEVGGSNDIDTSKVVEGANVQKGYDRDDIQVYAFSFKNYFKEYKDDAYKEIVTTTGGNIYQMGDSPSAEDIKNKLINDLANDIKDNIPPEESEFEEGELKDVIVQKGANANELMYIKLMDARAEKIGIGNLSVLTVEDAQASIGRIDSAITLVTRQRALFGAYDNTLGMTYDNLGEKEINITGADSRLMDTDISKEIMNLSIADILSNTSQAMLTQSIKASEDLSKILENWR